MKNQAVAGLLGMSASAREVRDAGTLVLRDRPRGLAALHVLFRSGTLPDPVLAGRYRGALLALDLMPGLTALFGSLARLWMPWRGKIFHPAQERGENIFTRDSYLLARLFNPHYRGFVPDGPETYRGFAFRTYSGPGLFDMDRTVWKIDYDLGENPALTVRRVLDELVQLDESLYLGKAHVRWWGSPADEWQTVAFFTLEPQEPSPSS